MIGRTIAHYEVTGKLGEGGMGVVYRARDTRLDRTVALKFLPTQFGVPRGDPVRFLQEARAASALDHPNICTVHGLETTTDGEMFIVMACYEGETLQARLERGRLDVGEAIEIARQVAEGLGRAHERGIVHRDIKPSNIFITRDGLVKILDFGVSRLLDESGVTRTGSQIGTVSYMAPEQARAEAVDQRVDVWALGAVVYEMLTGRRAFDGSHAAVVLQAIQHTEPAPLSDARPDVPPALIEIVARALRKDRTQRFADGRAMAAALRALSPATSTGMMTSVTAPVRRSRVVVPLVAAIAVLVAALGWLGYRWNRASWARHQALPEIARLAQSRQFGEAVELATRAERHIGGDPVLAKLWTDIAVEVSVESEPSAAVVEIAPYAEAAAWRALGTTPIAAVRLPKGAYRWRFSKAGCETIERGVQSGAGTMRVVLPAAGSVPSGMVLIPKATEVLMLAGFGLPAEVTFEDYFVGRHEVTNREFKRFVDAGGYRRREFWKHPFIDAGKTLGWEDAMTRFRDKVGQPGPALWEIGAYPAGADDLPVGGVSWFEAAAYAAFAGVSLPTLHHWYRAAGITAGPFLLPLANFGDRGPRAVGATGAMSPSGAFDMAGNVKEWVWTPTSRGLRHILGGGWGDPQYMFGQIEALTPFDRAPKNGFRVAHYSNEGPDAGSLGPFDRKVRDFVNERSVGDETFAQFARTFAYDTNAPLDARVEKTLDAAPDVAVERVSFAAAYDGERVIAYVWRPRHVAPPYQTLVVFPGAEALRPAGPEVLEQPNRYDFLVRSGRAVVHPVYRGMYERFTPRWTSALAFRQTAIRWVQDLRRTLDYLETRSDIDRSRIGYFGGSLGAGFAPVPLALEPRLRLAILIGGGLPTIDYEPDVFPLNYLPRVKVPTILMGGRYDYFIPYESAQKPFFERLGTPPEHKKHVVFEAPHSIPRSDYISEMLAWLDRYFGPAR
jgi:dienelactone hydrolase